MNRAYYALCHMLLLLPYVILRLWGVKWGLFLHFHDKETDSENSKVLLNVAHSGQELKAFVSTTASLLSTPFQEVRKEEGFSKAPASLLSTPCGHGFRYARRVQRSWWDDIHLCFLSRIPWCWCKPCLSNTCNCMLLLRDMVACFTICFSCHPGHSLFPPPKAVSLGVSTGSKGRDPQGPRSMDPGASQGSNAESWRVKSGRNTPGGADGELENVFSPKRTGA